jgi:hypothetical protein
MAGVDSTCIWQRVAAPVHNRSVIPNCDEESAMNDPLKTAAATGTLTLGGDLQVTRLESGAMRLTGAGI